MAGPSRSVPLQLAGVTVALLGLAAGAYAFTGDRIYDVAFLFVMVLGILLIGGGIALASWGRALARAPPRARRVPPPPRTKPERPAEVGERPGIVARIRPKRPEEPREKTPLLARVKAKLPARAANGEAQRETPREPKRARKRPKVPRDAAVLIREVPHPPLERVHLRCPDCRREFQAEGRRPFDTRCPGCGMLADVE